MTDPFPGNPAAQGQWRTVSGKLIWLGSDRVLEWHTGDGSYRMWRCDAGVTGAGDPLPGDPLCEGTWSIVSPQHELVYLGGDRMLEWSPGPHGGPYRIWHLNRNARGGDNPLSGDPVIEGHWDDTKLRYPELLYLGGDRVLNYEGAGGIGAYATFRYDRTVTGKGDPFSGPIVSGEWRTLRNNMISLDGDRLLETYTSFAESGDHYRLWRYDRDVTSGDPLPGSPIAEGKWNTVYPPLTYIGQNRVLQTNTLESSPPNDYKVWRYARDSVLAPGRSDSWQIEVGADDSVWAVDDSRRLWRWNGARWVQPTDYARAVQVTVGDCDHIWHLNSLGQIWHYLGEYWQQDPQVTALSIAAAADFTVWAISSRGAVLRRVGTVGATWDQPTPYAAGVQIAVGSKDMVWHRNSANEMWAWNGSSWDQIPGQALDIAVAADGTACRVGTDNRLYRWIGGQWLEIPTDGRVAQVTVGGANNIWYVSQDNHIFSWSGTEFGLKMTLPV